MYAAIYLSKVKAPETLSPLEKLPNKSIITGLLLRTDYNKQNNCIPGTAIHYLAPFNLKLTDNGLNLPQN